MEEGICLTMWRDAVGMDGLASVIIMRPCLEYRESEIAQECRRIMSDAKSFGAQFVALTVLESLPEVQ